MALSTESRPLTYLSSRSADVILSDVRPTKLKIEALRSINVLLDELLWQILNASGALSTERLKGGLAKVLPTPLGKEALLEAEVELRAYWERTNPHGSASAATDDSSSQDFSLQLAYELLRIKCEGYSTLNDTDEDADAEARLNARFPSGKGFKATLVAPAALYLTAILEFLCEHILSNVGRVASRDSSKADATVQDLFVALCEDESIYGLFKSMKVYDQIEAQSRSPRPRRSKSFSRNDFDLPQRPSPAAESVLGTDAPPVPSHSRPSSDSSVPHGNGSTPPSHASVPRTSTDKTRALKMFKSNGKISVDHDRSVNGHDPGESRTPHQRSNSTDGTKRTLVSSDAPKSAKNVAFEDESLMQDFDDLMRSGTTMKVSLTPDRLRTFEGYAKEKTQRTHRAPGPGPGPSAKLDPLKPALSAVPGEMSLDKPKRAGPGGRPTLRHVDSIIEDEEDAGSSMSVSARTRASSLATSLHPSTPENLPLPLPGSVTRVRSVSTSSPSTPPSSFSRSAPERSILSPEPKRTRRVVRSRESIGLDDVVNGSDDEDVREVVQVPEKKISGPKVSASTRDLIDFLSEGPPDMPDVPLSPSATLDSSRSKSGRLQRMMSRLTGGPSTERLNGRGVEGYDRRSATSMPTPSTPSLSAKRSLHNITLSSKSVPPRPRPTPASAPSSSPSQGSFEDVNGSVPHPHASLPEKTIPIVKTLPDPVPQLVSHVNASSITSTVPERVSSKVHVNGIVSQSDGLNDSPLVDVAGVTLVRPSLEKLQTDGRKSTVTRPKTVVTNGVVASPPPFAAHIKDLHRLLSTATTPDECRVVVNMFLAKCGLLLEMTGTPAICASEPPVVSTSEPTDFFELSLVELLLADGGSTPNLHLIQGTDVADVSVNSKDTPDRINDMTGQLLCEDTTMDVITPSI